MKQWLNHSIAIATILLSFNVTAQENQIANKPSARAGLRSGVVGRAIVGGEFIGTELATYELNTVFGSVNGRWGESREIDGVLYTPGNANRSPVVSKLNLQTGQTTTLVLEGEGSVSGIFKKEGQIFFVGFSIGDDGGYDVTYWNNLGNATVISSLSDSNANFVSYDGRMVLQIGNHTAGYADVGNNILHTLPGFLNFKLNPTSITPNNRFIGVGGFDQDSTIGLIYELNPTSGEYVLLNVNYRATRGEDMSLMYLFDSPHGVLSASLYLNLETYQDETAIFSLDGTVRAELEGIPRAAVAVGDKVFVATQGVEGRITAFNKTWGKEEYTSAQIFGVPGIEFQAGSLAATADGKLVVIGTRVSDGKVFVKTFEVPQDATLSQVDVNSISIPSLVVGQGGNITWAPVAGATGYEYQISKGGVVVSNGSVSTNSLAVPTNLAPGTYEFSVRPSTTARALPSWSSKTFTVSDLPDYIKNVLVKLPAGGTDFQIQIVPKKGKVLVYSGMTNIIAGLMALAPGKYVVKVLIPKKRVIVVNIEKFHPAVVPVVKVMPDRKHVISWTGDGVAEIWVAKKNQQSKVVYLMKVSKGNVHKLAKALPAGEYVVRVRLNKADGSKSLWGGGVGI